MTDYKWATPSAESSNLAGTALNSLANGTTSARIGYDNSTAKDTLAKVTVELGSITPGTDGMIFLRTLHRRGTADGDITEVLRSYPYVLSSGAGAKRAVWEEVELHPFDMGFVVTNRSGTTLASSGNGLWVQPYNRAGV